MSVTTRVRGADRGTGGRLGSGPLSADSRVPALTARAAPVLVAAASVVIYLFAIRGRLLEDDWVYLNRVQQPGWWHSAAIWKPGHVLWRPVLYLWFGLLHALFGLHPLPYHLATEAVILVEAGLAGLLARRLGLRTGAIVTGAVVCLHASMATPVAWTSAASSPISVSLGLGALLLVRRGGPGRIAGAVGLFALGLLTREVVAVIPAIAVVLAWAAPPERGRRRAVIDTAPLWAVLVAYGVIRLAVGFNSSGPYAQGVSTRAGHNLWHLAQLATDLYLPAHGHVTQAIAALGWLLVAVVVTSAVVRGRRLEVAGLAWVVIGVLPVVFLLHQPMYAYYLDLALTGLGLLAGAVVDDLVGRRLPVPGAAVATAAVAALVVAGAVVSRLEVHQLFSGPSRRTATLTAGARRLQPVDGTIHLRGLIDADTYITGDGDLYRVLLHRPHLRIVGNIPLGPTP